MARDKRQASGYDAFISYSQAMSGMLAAALQHWLERFATPWYRPRSLRIFRDYTSLSATDNLDRDIEQALSSSTHFILLASPEAAKSSWVDREVRWWRDNRQTNKVCIVLTSGQLRWDMNRNDWDPDHTASLPPAARGMFRHEPLWVDLSSVQTTSALDRSNPVLLNSVAAIAAPLRGVDKDTLVGEHIAYFRRARLQRRGGIVALAVLTVAAVVAASLARIQSDNATHQARIATGRALAAAAVQDLTGNLRLAQLLAVEAYQLNPDADSRSALFQAVTASPALVRFLSADSTVTTLAASGNGKYFFAGTHNGYVFRWSTAGFRRLVVAKLPAGITSVSSSSSGTTVAAADGSEAIVWTPRDGARRILVPAGQRANMAGVSPSGRFVVVASYLPGGAHGAATLRDMLTGLTSRAAVNTTNVFPATAIAVPSDRQAVLFSTAGYVGVWQQLSLPTLTRLHDGILPVGAHDYAWALSPRGDLATSSNGDPSLPIWALQPSATSPRFQATGAGPIPTAIAISANDQMTATAANGSIYVGKIGLAGASAPGPTQLQGSPTINPGALAFVGNSKELISASGSSVALWNLNQFSRTAMQMSAAVPQTCMACGGDWLSVDPGSRIAAATYPPLTTGQPVTVQQLDAPFREQLLSGRSAAVYATGPTAWSPDGRTMYLPTSVGIEVLSAAGTWPRSVKLWPDPMAGRFVQAISTSPDDRHVIVIGSTNTIEIRSAETGRVIEHFRGPAAGKASFLVASAGTAAVSPDGSIAAIITPRRGVDIINLSTHAMVPIGVGGVAQVFIGGSYLAILLINGSVDLWSLSLKRFVAISQKINIGTVAMNESGTLLAEYIQDGTVVMQDLTTGQTFGSLQVQPSIFGSLPTSLAFSPDSSRLVIAIEGDGATYASKLEQLYLSSARWVSIACATAGAGMTQTEWRAVVGTAAPAKLACDKTSQA